MYSWKHKWLSGVLALLMVITSCVPAFAAEQDAEGKYYYTSEYSSRQAVLDAGNALAREIAGEGMVMLKNADAALPVAKGASVTVLGKNSVNPVYSGGGSGNGALGAGGDPTDLYEALEATGFVVNPVMKAFYEEYRAVRCGARHWLRVGHDRPHHRLFHL